MKSFSDFGIVSKKSFVGDKIYIEKILDQEIIIEFYEIRPSKKANGGDCLYMQIKLAGVDHVVFSSSMFLMNPLKQIKDSDFPFTAKIVKVNQHYEFR